MAPYTRDTIKQDNKNRDFILLYRGHRGVVGDTRRTNVTFFFCCFTFFFTCLNYVCLPTATNANMNTDYYITIKR